MSDFNLSSFSFDLPEIPRVPSAEAWADTQFEIICRYVKAFQQTLDDTTDVGLMLTNFGQTVLMEVTSISYEYPVLMVFTGLVQGREATLIQHINQLSFLLTKVPKAPGEPHRQIVVKGFTSDQEEE